MADRQSNREHICTCTYTERQTDRQTDRQAGRKVGRQAGRQTDRQTKNRQTERQTDKHKTYIHIQSDILTNRHIDGQFTL